MGEKNYLKKLSARQKAKGLQRLRWYCQMCEKQCRDENGFRNHCRSESHTRKMHLFSERPGEFLAEFSDAFHRGFMDILRKRFGTTMVKANNVYQEYIKDKTHVHMNGTRWTTLTGYVMWLGREGICRVEDRGGEEGWFISYVDQEVLERARRAREMEQEKLDDEERTMRAIRRQMRGGWTGAVEEDASKSEQGKAEVKDHQKETIVEVSDEPIKPVHIELKRVVRPERPKLTRSSPFGVVKKVMAGEKHADNLKRKRTSNIDDIIEEEERKKMIRAGNRGDPLQPPSTNGETCVSTWLHRDIVVKVLDPGEWFGKKGIIKSVVDDQAIICFPDSDQQVEFHDRSLETVIPKPGGKVLILSGSLRGTPAVIRNIDVDNYSTSIETLQGVLLERIPYESVSRLWEQTSS